MASFTWLLLAAGVVTMAAALGVSFVIVQRGLGPLNWLAGRIAGVREEDLSVQIPSKRMPSEMVPVVERLNELLGRLAVAFERERGFTADVAHELRTPLTGTRATIEVALSRERGTDEYVEALGDCLAITDRMLTMVEKLLMLARLDTGQVALRRDTVLLGAVVDACWTTVAESATSRKLCFENRAPADLVCTTDHDSLAMVFANLLENAADYANEGGDVWVTARRLEDKVEITVGNSGCTLSAEEAAQVFERFWRADASRQDTGIHCGLGLAVVRRIVTSLGGSVAADVGEGGVFTVTIILPGL